MEKTDLLNLAEAAISRNLELVNSVLSFRLPLVCVHSIHLSSMIGTPLLSLDAAISYLLTPMGFFPPIVDLLVRGCTDNKTLVVWLRSGHPDVSEISETWNDGYGPFKPMGLMIPFELASGEKLTKSRMEKLGSSWLTLAANG